MYIAHIHFPLLLAAYIAFKFMPFSNIHIHTQFLLSCHCHSHIHECRMTTGSRETYQVTCV